MEQIAGLPVFPVEFTREGSVFKQDQVDALKQYLNQESDAGRQVTDLLVMAHGWNNNMAEAHFLYTKLLTNAAPELLRVAASRRFAVVGLYWPSKKFTDSQFIAGGGAAGLADTEQPSPAQLEAQLEELRDSLVNAPGKPVTAEALEGLERAQKALPDIEDEDKGPVARQELLDGLRAALQTERAAILGHGEPDGASVFLDGNPDDVWSSLLEPPLLPDVEDLEGGGAATLSEVNGALDSGGAASFGEGTGGALDGGGAADFLGDLTKKLRTGAEMMMNLSTYYMMKGRAGEVGLHGAFQALREIADANPDLRIHLVGHSFGGRLVASIALGPDGSAPLPLASLTLLQAAFSHNGFSPDFPAPNGGFFKRVLAERHIQGPIVITYTKNDSAVGYAYPLASRMSRDNAKALGDSSDPFGGVGRNGALHIEHAAVQASTLQLAPETEAYDFHAGAVYNLNADQYVKGHSDVTGPQVAHALVSAITASG